ncbi:MAG: glycosyltransferase family 4 protein [Elusimicrobiota bacterium]
MKLKICMLLERFYPVVGGTELQAQRLAVALINSGNDVFVLTTRLSGFLKFEVIDGLSIYRSFSRGKGTISSLFFLFSSFLFLLKNRQKYDIIQVYLASSHAFPAIIIKKLLGKKIILKFGGARKTGDIETSTAKPCGKLKLKIISQNFDAFVVPSKEVYQEVVSAGFPEKKISIIANGVDTSRFQPVSDNEKIRLRKLFNFPSEKLICVYTGRIEKGKGLEILLEVWKKIPEKIMLLIIGEGLLLDELKKAFPQKNIHFFGFQKNVADFLAVSNLFVLPSFGEGLSNALLEAMSSGLIILANNIPANAEVITDNHNGLLIDFRDINKAGSTISAISTNINSYLKLGIHARQTVIEKFSLPYIAKKYFQLYKKVLDKT